MTGRCSAALPIWSKRASCAFLAGLTAGLHIFRFQPVHLDDGWIADWSEDRPLVSPSSTAIPLPNERIRMSPILLLRIVLTLGVGLLLAGCVGAPFVPDASATHPANPHAAASPIPPFETGLLSLTNLAVPTAPSGGEPGHQHHSVQP